MAKKKSLYWKWSRYREGLWLPHKKRMYLYWFKFLQEAERSSEFTVNWNKYPGWGGPTVVLGQKFDEWWEDRWKDLFGVPQDLQIPVKFPLTTTQPKSEALRISWLVWLHRHTPTDYTPKKYGGAKLLTFSRRGSNHIAIARKIIATEKRKETYLVPLDPDDDSNENEDQVIASLIGRYKRRAKMTTENVCEDMFP